MRTERIVVGVDGSPGSRAALQWAADEAVARAAELEAVTAWHFPALAALPGPSPDLHDLIRMARDTQDEALAEVDLHDLPVHRSVVQGHTAGALLSRLGDDTMLVVGAGHRHAGLGSTAQQCAMHATCPVVVVPA